ncbi:MAG: hypothetical protein C5B55_11365, partial [Blastocatellia bacterium]
ESKVDFDPKQTALLEMHASELPSLPGGPLTPGSSVRITNYEPNRIRYETSATTATILVASEIFYPGWKANVDGIPARILLTDYLLRGVYLPAGAHTIELRYTATAARNGSFISIISIAIVGVLFFASRKKDKPV